MSLHCHDIVTKPLLLQGEVRLMLCVVKPFHTNSRISRGFSLIEMLATVAIMALLTGLLVPTIGGLLDSGRRRSAIIKILNASEFARATALETGTNVFIGFATADFPASDSARGFPFTRFITFRTKNPSIDTTVTASDYVLVTGWESLPSGISFGSVQRSALKASGQSNELTIAQSDGFPQMPDGGKLRVIRWDSLGMISQPTAGLDLMLYIYDGFFQNNQDNFTKRAQNPGQTLFDQIIFSRFTGRGRVALTTVD